MPIEQYTYWSVTINNPDENDYLIIRNPNSKYVRECVWTREVGGQEHTEHIQAWVRLQRNQGMAFMKKLYPRGHFKHTDKDVYNENAHQYAQKNDETTAGNHHILLNDPLPAVDTTLYKVLQEAFENRRLVDWRINKDLETERICDVFGYVQLKDLNTDYYERKMIQERQGLEKVFISPTYEKMKRKYWKEILCRIYKDITEDARSSSRNCESGSHEEVERETQTDSDHYEDSSSTEDEGLSESGSSCGSSEDACSEC